MAALFCSMGSAQSLIYSNAFNGSSSSLFYTAPQVANSTVNGFYTGGTNNAVWVFTTNDYNFCSQDGAIDGNGGAALLPFTPLSGNVYIETCVYSIPTSSELMVGFTSSDNTNAGGNGNSRFLDPGTAGYSFTVLKVGGTSQFFGGKDATDPSSGGLSVMPSAGIYTNEIILSVVNSNWVAASFVNGVKMGTNILYRIGAYPPIHFAGIGNYPAPGQSYTALVQWMTWTLSMLQAPLIFTNPPSTSANQGASFTESAVFMAPTNCGNVVCQWYNNGTLISQTTFATNTLFATNTTSFTLNPVTPGEAGTNYYLVVTNSYGSVTSAPASLVVNGPPTFTSAFPVTYTNLGSTNLLFLYGGSGPYYGSSPSFSVFASGAQPISYYWFTNGVPVGGATTSFALTNVSITGPTNFTCMASNFVGTATNIWVATYLPSPTTPFQAAVMAAQPLAYWRLNDTNLDGVDNGSGDDGYICHEYESGNDGIYTNVTLANNRPSAGSYSPMTDPSEPSAQFGAYNGAAGSSYVNSIGGTNIDFSGNSNAEYTVALWANGAATGGYAEAGNSGLFCKGYFNGEEACLDTDPHTDNLRLTLRNAAGAQFNVVSTEALGLDSNWHYIVGECDESNGLISLFVDGQLEGQTNIPSGSGIFNSSTVPITIGARSSTATGYGDQQFLGNINDVAVYGYALSPTTIVSQYEAAGYSPPPYVFFLVTPPTNVVYLTNATITLPATAYGTPPLGYYWTNLTTATVIASGTTNVYADLNATLTLQDVNGNLNGDILELVVTNASGSINALVNDLSVLTNPPPSTPYGYTNTIIYSNSFNADALSVGGLLPTAFNDLYGTNEWILTFSNNAANAGTVYANGALGTNAGNALLPFTPEPGFIYTMTASLTALSSMNDWVSMGFTEYGAQQSVEGFTRFDDNPPNGFAWMYVQNTLGVFEAGPSGTGASTSISSVPLPSALTPVTLQIILNTITNNAWVSSASINGTGIGTNVYSSNQPIAYAGIGQNQLTAGASGIQWNYWTLTAVSPNGYPPYLVKPVATNSILLTNATVTLPATAIGTGPWGYYWNNNSSVIASGTSATTAPLTATLSVPSTSLSAGQLELVLTNSLGTNITLITLISPVNPNPTNIVATVTNSTLYLTWPVDHKGWQLQAQTNSVRVGISNDWVNYNPSTGTNQVAIPIVLTNGTVFYRLTY